MLPIFYPMKVKGHTCSLVVATFPRFYLPVKPCLTSANLGNDGFAELGTRFKASHVKLIIWWLARETQEFADRNPQVPWAVLDTKSLGEDNLSGSTLQSGKDMAIVTIPHTTNHVREKSNSRLHIWSYPIIDNLNRCWEKSDRRW